MPELFSYFKTPINVKGAMPTSTLDVGQALDMIRKGVFREDVERLRASDNESTQKVLKKGLHYFTFSGMFKTREEAALTYHSGLICLDFDDLKDMPAARAVFEQLPFVLACFMSPSGTGYKVIVRIDPKLHAESFVSLEWLFAAYTDGLTVDASGVDVCRACFASYDPELYHNPDATNYEVDPSQLPAIAEHLKPVEAKPKLTPVEQNSSIKRLDHVVQQIEEQGIDLTEDYQHWMYIFFSLSTLGEEGREYLHRVSQFNPGYSRRETDYKFNNAVRKSRFTTPAKFFDLAKAAGVDITSPDKIKVASDVVPVAAVLVQDEPISRELSKGGVNPVYVLENESHGEPLHLVTTVSRAQELLDKEYPNILHSVMKFDEIISSKLRAISNTVRFMCDMPNAEFDLCDAIVSKRFKLQINTGSDDYTAYHKILLDYYSSFKGWDDEADRLLELCMHISFFPNALERDTLCATIAKTFKKTKSSILAEVNGFIAGREEAVQELEEDEDALPKWVDRDQFYRYGFVWRVDGIDTTGIYFNVEGYPKRLTNFVLTPLIHVYTKEEQGNRRLTELQSGYFKTVIELPTKAFTSMEAFDNIITSEGAFYTLDGFSKSHLNRLKAYYLGEYPKCFELNTLGWQPEGFFSFSNIIYKNQLINYNAYGYAEVDGQNFLSMGASSALEGVRAEDDIYKNDKYLSYKEAEITFERWCRLMVGVYPEHGMMGIAFACMSVFKDLLFKRNNNFPMLYAYGAVQAGKSKFAESVCNLFLHDKPMFNLNQGTDFGFFSELGMYRNVPVGLNEFDENAIKEEWFRALKGAFDGEGRKKGSGLRNKTKTQEIHAAVILIGQYLSTKDDNSVLSRTLPCKFTENNKRSPEQIAMYDELKLQEKKGISSLLCDILQQRDHVSDHFTLRFQKVGSELKAAFTKLGMQPKNRIIENYTTALTTISLIADKLPIGFTYEQFFTYSVAEIQKLAGIMSESNSLSTFWKTVEFLLVQNFITNGWHYKIKVENELRVNAGRVDGKLVTKTINFDEPKKLLFIRLNTIHPLYAKEIKNITGKPGQNEQTILTYMKDQEYYLGLSPGGGFSDGKITQNTSSYVFDYDLIGVNLETYKDEQQDPDVTLEGQLYNDAELVDMLNIPMLKFTLYKDESYYSEGQRIKKEILTYCHCPDVTQRAAMLKTRQVKLTGQLQQSKTGHRSMMVRTIELTETLTPTPLPEGEEAF